MREFTTAIEQADQADQEVDEGIEFSVDGVLCRAYKPNDGQFAMLMAMTTQHSSEQEQVAALVNFIVNVMDDESQAYIVKRMFDRQDKFGLKELRDIFEALVEDWTGNPTQPPSASTPSRQRGGKKSTPRTPALT